MTIFDKSSLNSLETLIKTSQDDGACLLIDKDLQWTSFDVAAKIRNITREKKIGHAGTLDPLATGLLIVCIGRKATREIDKFRDMPKTYEAVIKLGAVTDTDDAEADEQNIQDIRHITEQSIRDIIMSFVGKFDQMPPKFSAKKINGKSAYKLARKNLEVELKAVPVEIYNIIINDINLPYVKMEVNCSKGTYIRSLAKDIGNLLGCGAYLAGLRRTKIGEYDVINALNINDLVELANKRNDN